LSSTVANIATRIALRGRRRLRVGADRHVGREDCFCTRESAFGQYGALDRKAILDADLALMIMEGPAIVANHGFTTGKRGLDGY
jgi:7,8-dihydropterin-6-yl-methyl-4-(beta-D-ribofuranosyl)aminobenzene 5'-phosphate synthase